MKNPSGHISLVVAALILSAAATASAEKMDAEIHTVVIEKLEQSLAKARESGNLSLKPVRARLADLYAERARLRAMNEDETGCQNCRGSLEDRKKALSLYDKVLAEAPKENRGPLLLQMAQLNELNRDVKKSDAVYERIIKEGARRHKPEILAEAILGRAERRFERGDTAGAQKDFEAAFKLVGPDRKGPVLHRIAWCFLNKGEQIKAVKTLIHILETPALLSRETGEGQAIDLPFQEDVARDLATFFARSEVSRREISLLESLTPESSRKEVVRHFANECERLGQRKAAILAWSALVKYEEQNSDRLEVMIRVTQIRFDLGEKSEALKGIREIVHQWNAQGNAQGCANHEICTQLQARLRAIIISWNKQEKNDPSMLLVEAYLAYLSKFSEDMEMIQWAADSARAQKRYATAATLYHKSAVLASKSTAKNAKQVLEAGLVGEVEMAELSKNTKAREVAYNHYLQLNPDGAVSAKVRYQRAHAFYERGDLAEASNRFHDFATSSACRVKPARKTLEICTQAADLDLDSLAGMKAHATVQVRAAEYGRIYPHRQAEYIRISRTAVMKQAEGQEPQVAIGKLAEADLRGASSAERIRFLKTWLSLSERQRDLVAVRTATHELLAIKTLSAEDRELALGKAAWTAEMSLDFAEAYTLTLKMKLAKMSAEEKALRLALLAELAGHDPRKHEEEFLRVSKDPRRKAAVRAKIVRSSKRPLIEFAKQEKQLRLFPSVYAALALELFAQTGDVGVASRALQVRGVAMDPAGRVLARELSLREFAKTDHALARHRLASTSEMMVQKSLAARFGLLAGAERAANQAIASKDWVLQILTLNVLSRENLRVYKDILALPVPKRLRGKDRETYVKLVEGKARGYRHKHEQIEKKIALLWGRGESQEAIERDIRLASPAVRTVLAGHLRRLRDVAPGGIRRQIDDELKSPLQMPTEQQVVSARKDAKESPFNTQTLTRLRDLETNRGRETMVAYLDARLSKLKTGVKQ